MKQWIEENKIHTRRSLIGGRESQKQARGVGWQPPNNGMYPTENSAAFIENLQLITVCAAHDNGRCAASRLINVNDI